MEQNFFGRFRQYLAAALLATLMLGGVMATAFATAAVVGGVEVGLAALTHGAR
jgi:hypothetical protein